MLFVIELLDTPPVHPKNICNKREGLFNSLSHVAAEAEEFQ
jgi:hypothetical protein